MVDVQQHPAPQDPYAVHAASPEGEIVEVIDDVAYMQARPRPRHARVVTRLAAQLNSFDGGDAPGGWQLLIEPEIHLPRVARKPQIVVPDLAGWTVASMPELPADEAAIKIAPDFVCEVLSPSTAVLDRSIKMPLYGIYSVSYAWLIDPVLHTVEVFRLGADHCWTVVTVVAGDTRVRLAPFEAVEIDLARLWSTR